METIKNQMLFPKLKIWEEVKNATMTCSHDILFKIIIAIYLQLAERCQKATDW